MAPSMKIRILGCGTSGGVPIIGNFWGSCDPENPRNRRLRSSVLVEMQGKKILIDTSPDLRQQLLAADVGMIDAVLYTHAHADHVHGINDLVTICRFNQTKLPVYGDQKTIDNIKKSFAYAFLDKESIAPIYTPCLKDKVITVGTVDIEGVSVQAFTQDHGFMDTLGFRLGDFAYSTDVCRLDAAAFDVLNGTKVWVVDCMRREPHETHSHLAQTLSWIDKIKPEKAYLTHMGVHMDYETLKQELPPHVAPAYDGLDITL